MSDRMVSVEHLSKRYRIGLKEQQPRTLREATRSVLSSPFRYLLEMSRPPTEKETLWPLRDVSFEINRGDVVGIIGRNGAGKSTLLKILARITEPTSGRAVLNGRVGSLLEVGTGFHPDLTGRENVYLNGAVLGMKRQEIDRKFDEIVAFSEVEAFIDTPVKRYSSGMSVRLAFAVAAHLEPEILIIDEVLAVGDANFQRKCLGKMEDVSQLGRTILFVSHNMQAVRTLCTRGIVLDKGHVLVDSTAEEALNTYYQRLRTVKIDANTDIANPETRRGSGAVRFTHLAVRDTDGLERFSYPMGATVRFEMAYEVFRPVEDLYALVALRSGQSADFVTTVRQRLSAKPLPGGTKGEITIEVPNLPVRPGLYPLYFWLGDGQSKPYDVIDDLTQPLDMSLNPDMPDPGVVPGRPAGYVSLPFKVIQQSQH
jgi:lipopolysaccharide transport system ATP-binding protein